MKSHVETMKFQSLHFGCLCRKDKKSCLLIWFIGDPPCVCHSKINMDITSQTHPKDCMINVILNSSFSVSWFTTTLSYAYWPPRTVSFLSIKCDKVCYAGVYSTNFSMGSGCEVLSSLHGQSYACIEDKSHCRGCITKSVLWVNLWRILACLYSMKWDIWRCLHFTVSHPGDWNISQRCNGKQLQEVLSSKRGSPWRVDKKEATMAVGWSTLADIIFCQGFEEVG